MKPKLPLEGIKVLELARVGVGPTAGRTLGICGATVIHVETARKPDSMRTMFPYKDSKPGINRGAYFNKFNTDKFGICLDATKPEGSEIMRRLVKWADIFIESNAPGITGKLGFDYEKVKEMNPAIIMLSTSQMGQEGPLAQYKGYGVQAAVMAGFHEMTGYPDSGPIGPWGAYTDAIAPPWLITAMIAALDYRRRTGKGQYLDHSQLETGVYFLAPLVPDYSANGHLPERVANREPLAAPHGCYRCSGDDHWCTIAVHTEEEWGSFCNAIGSPDWTKQDKFGNFVRRKENEDELDKLVEAWTINHTSEEVMRLMQGAGIAAGVVSSGQDLTEDPQLNHRGHFKTLNHTEIGTYLVDDLAFQFSETPCQARRAAPCLGEHTEYVCREILGMSDEEFIQLLQAGVFE